MRKKINENLSRKHNMDQMNKLQKTIDASGGDIESKVRKSSKSKESMMPNAIYMDNPLTSNRKISTYESFTKTDNKVKTTASKSTEPKGNKKMCSFSDFTCEGVDNNVNEELFLWGGNYVNGTHKVKQGTDGKDDNGKSYDIKKGDELTVLDYFDKTKSYSVEYNDKKYVLSYEILEYLFDRKFRVEEPKMDESVSLNESTRTEFMLNYSDELKAAVGKIKKMSGIIDNMSEEFFEETVNKITKKMKTYDSNVDEKIDNWVNSPSGDVDEDEIVRFALDNYDRFGTEPQFVLFAIDDVYNIVNKDLNEKLKFSDGEEFETSGKLRKEERKDGWYVLGQGMLIPVKDEDAADEYIKKHKKTNEGRIPQRDESESRIESSALDDLKSNFRSYEGDDNTVEDAEEVLGILLDRHPDEDEDKLRDMVYSWCGVETEDEKNYNRDYKYHGRSQKYESLSESKKSEETKSHINTSIDNWIQELDSDVIGTTNDKLRPMFVNRPNNEIRPPYDINRAGKYVNIDGQDGQVVGLKNGKVLIDIINKDNKHEIVEMTMKEVLKSNKKDKKEKKDKKD